MEKYIIKDEKPVIVYEKINQIGENVLLKGYTHRIIRRANIDNIDVASQSQIEKETKVANRYLSLNNNIRNNKLLFGTVLHIDGDKDYLESCLSFYKKMNIHAWGIYIKEKEIKDKIINILNEITPDIVVITGHDTFNGKSKKDIENYENSKIYMDIVRRIRSIYSKEELVIIVGACCSHYEALIASGANFASSPGRINIHTYDPAVVACKVATTSCNKIIDYEAVIKHIIDGKKAIGGIETKGKMKIIY